MQKQQLYWRPLVQRAFAETLKRARIDEPWTAIFALGPTIIAGIGAWRITGNITSTALWTLVALAAVSLLHFLWRLALLPKTVAREEAAQHRDEVSTIRLQRDEALLKLAALMPGEHEAFEAHTKSILARLTDFYISSHDGVSPRILAGMELPPEQWLNAELARTGLRWRVRNIRGAQYDITDAEP